MRPGERVALKPNLLLAATPDKGITTHPAVVEAVALEVRAAGATPFVVESPGAGIPYSERSLEKVYRITGLREMAERIDLPPLHRHASGGRQSSRRTDWSSAPRCWRPWSRPTRCCRSAS